MTRSDGFVKALLLTGGCFLGGTLAAQDAGNGLATLGEVAQAPTLDTSEIEIGLGNVNQDSFKFGEYNGLQSEGLYGIGNLKIRKYVAPDSTDKTYWQLNGRNLGLDNRSLYGEYDPGGRLRLTFDYDQIPHNRFDDGRTPFIGAGTADQTLPSTWVGASSTSGLTDLLPSLHDVDVQTERKRFGAGFIWHLTDQWQLSGNYRHETKTGQDSLGAVFGDNGGDPRSSILVRPIDYVTNEFAIATSYTGDKRQYSLSYQLSLFNDNVDAIVWDNPFNNSQWDPGANFSDGARGRMSSEPDNKASQLSFSGGYDLGRMTRVTTDLSYGRMTQNQPFLPYSNVFPTVIPLPRSSLDGRVKTIFAHIGLSTRLTAKLGLTGRYTYDNRDNKTPQDLYVRIPGDTVNQGGLLQGDAEIDLPYSFKRKKAELEANYNVLTRSRLSVGYEYEDIHRDFTEVDSTGEHTAKLRFTFQPLTSTSGWIRYRHSSRRGSSYVSNQPFLSGHSAAYIAYLNATAPGDLYANDPLMRKFHIADRDRDQVAAAVSYSPGDVLTFTLSGQHNRDAFNNTEDGLQRSENGYVSLDAGYTPSEKISFNAYVTNERYRYKQRGFYHPGFAGPLTPTTDRIAVFGDNWWTMDSKETVHTRGADLDWKVIKDKLDVKIDVLVSHARTRTTPYSDGLAFLPIPDAKTNLSEVKLTSEYKFKKNMGLRFLYIYQPFDATDYANDLVAPDTLSNVILLGNSTPTYSAHVFAVVWFYNWH